MDIDEVIEKVIRIPRDFYTRRTISFRDLVVESGYVAAYEQVTEQELLKALRSHPEYIADWDLLSGDKRTTEGWYFTRTEFGYEVGYYHPSGTCDRKTYSDSAVACAGFVRNEVEQTRHWIENEPPKTRKRNRNRGNSP